MTIYTPSADMAVCKSLTVGPSFQVPLHDGEAPVRNPAGDSGSLDCAEEGDVIEIRPDTVKVPARRPLDDWHCGSHSPDSTDEEDVIEIWPDGITSTIPQETDADRGVVWVDTIYGIQPDWPEGQPAQQNMINELIKKWSPHRADIRPLGEGAWNNVYEATTAEKHGVLRVSLPVIPGTKTTSEAATLEFLSKTTSFPVARVQTYCCNRDNDIGYEYIVQDKMPGEEFEAVFSAASLSSKLHFVRQYAIGVAQLLRAPLRFIGSIAKVSGLPQMGVRNSEEDEQDLGAFEDWGGFSPPTIKHTRQDSGYSSPDYNSHEITSGEVTIGPPNGLPFAVKELPLIQRFRRPYHTSNEMLHAYVDSRAVLARVRGLTAEQEEVLVQTTQRLKRFIDARFRSSTTGAAERTYLMHGDDSLNNILVDSIGEDGQYIFTALIDLEFAQVVPEFVAYDYPVFLQDDFPKVCPDPEMFEEGAFDDDYLAEKGNFDRGLMKEEFTKTIEVLRPGWTEMHKLTSLDRRLLKATLRLSEPKHFHMINVFLDENASEYEKD